MKKIIFLLISLILFSSFLLRKGPTTEIVESIINYFRSRPMEKVFVHINKPFYAAGDEVWFAAYVLDFNTNSPSQLSEILHLEIFDSNGNSVVHHKTEIKSGYANGLIQLPKTLSPDYYLVKAYTNWVKNYDDGLAFSRHIKIVSPTFEANEDKNEWLNFYPEGGRLVSGKLNNLVFKTNISNKSTAFLINDSGDTLDNLVYDGNKLGKVRIVPDSQSEYYLHLENSPKPFKIPKSEQSGTILRFSEKNQSLNLYIENSLDLNGEKVSVILLKDGNILSALDKTLNERGIFIQFPKEKLKGGLYHVVVANQDKKIINQRLFFHEKKAESNILFSGNKQFEIGEDIQFTISQESWIKSPVSIAITPDKFFKNVATPKISFHNMDTEAIDRFSINNYLITKNMNSYQIEDVLKNKPPKFDYPIEKSDLFQVNVGFDSTNRIPDDYHSITLKALDSANFYFSKSKNKRLSFTIPSFNGQRTFIVKPHNWNSLEMKDAVDYQILGSYNVDPFEKDFNQSQEEYQYAKYAKENQAIERFYSIESKRRISNYKEQITFSILNAFDASIDLKDYVVLPDMTTVIRELLEGVKMKKEQNGNYRIQINSIDERTGYFHSLLKEDPLLLIDGLPVYDSKIIAELDPLDVKTVNLSYGMGTLNDVSYGGILAIETIEGNYEKVNQLGQGVFDLYGYADSYEFLISELDPNTPNFRSTTYWNPQVLLEKEKPITIKFSNPYEVGEYRVDIQGINEEGDVISETFAFEVVEKIN